MSPPTLSIPQGPVSSGYRSTTPSPTLSHKTVSSRSPLSIVPSATLSRSPVIEAVPSSAALVPHVSLAVQKQHHSRSQSLPSMQDQFPACLEFTAPPVPVPRDSMQPSAASILSQRRENLLSFQTCASYAPPSPRLMPLMSPGAVTPMQLEEDVEYRFPTLVTPLRHSPLVAALAINGNVEDEDSEPEQPIKICPRSR